MGSLERPLSKLLSLLRTVLNLVETQQNNTPQPRQLPAVHNHALCGYGSINSNSVDPPQWIDRNGVIINVTVAWLILKWSTTYKIRAYYPWSMMLLTTPDPAVNKDGHN